MRDYKSILTAPVYYRESYIQKNYPDLYKEVQEKPEDLSFKEKLYWTLNNIETYPVCSVCGNRVKFLNITQGYYQFCSLKCSNNSLEIRAKKEKTSMDRHGVKHFSNPSKSKQTRLERYGDPNFTNQAKREQTCLERYGVRTIMNTPEFANKSKQTKLEKYGDPNYVNLEKRERTCMERYGNVSYISTQEFRDRSRQTKLERYGDPNYSNPEKREQTCLERYGVSTNILTPEFQKLSRKTCLEKYGVEYPSQSQDIQVKMKDSRKLSVIDSIPEVIDVTEDGSYVCRCPHIDCTKCKDKIYLTTPNVLYNRKKNNLELCTNLCSINHNLQNNTSIEIFVHLILDRYDIPYIKNDRTVLDGQELDIYIPDYKLAIECNGVRWHSTNNNIPKDKHYNKYKTCQEKGIQLLTVWEDQIINNPQIIESIILSKLHIYNSIIYARQCELRKVSYICSSQFLDQYHLQGHTNGSSVRIGLFYRGELVSLMTFGKTRKYTGGSKDLWELHRYCSKAGVCVVGGASRLFNRFVKKYNVDQVESFSSNDISIGQLYKILGFQQESVSKSYWYIDKQYHRYHRYNFTKYKLIKTGADPALSETQIMKSRGYYQIYDTGQTRWIYKTPTH